MLDRSGGDHDRPDSHERVEHEAVPRPRQGAVERLRATMADLFAPGKQQLQTGCHTSWTGFVQYVRYLEQRRAARFCIGAEHGGPV